MLAGGLTLACFYIGVRAIQRRGWPMLRYATFIPTLIAVAFLVRVALPSSDATLSVRQFAQTLPPAPALAVFEVHRSVEYGLAFYRNQPVWRYEGGEHVSGVLTSKDGIKKETVEIARGSLCREHIELVS